MMTRRDEGGVTFRYLSASAITSCRHAALTAPQPRSTTFVVLFGSARFMRHHLLDGQLLLLLLLLPVDAVAAVDDPIRPRGQDRAPLGGPNLIGVERDDRSRPSWV